MLAAAILLSYQTLVLTSASNSRAYILSGELDIIQIDTQPHNSGDGTFDSIETIKNSHRMLA